MFPALFLLLVTVAGIRGAYELSPERRLWRKANRELATLSAELARQKTLGASIDRELTRALDSYQEERIQAQLQELPIEHLRSAGASNVRYAALRAAGIGTLADLANHRGSLQSIPGVGSGTATQVRDAFQQVVRTLESEPVELPSAELEGDAALKVGQATLLASAAKRALTPTSRALKAEVRVLQAEVAKLKAATSFMGWVQRIAREEVPPVDLPNGRRVGSFSSSGAYRTSRKAREDLKKRSRRPLEAKRVRREFRAEFARNAALVERAAGSKKARASGRAKFGCPDDVAEAIERQELDPAGLDVVLRGYQEFGAKFLLVQRRTLLGDEMGLGKTVQALAAMTHLGGRDAEPKHFLVVAPASLMRNWEAEVASKTTLEAHVIHGPDRDFAREAWAREGGVGITSYATCRNVGLASDLEHRRLALLVVDEAHYVKNPNAQRTLAVRELLGKSDRAAFMTGTPIENKWEEFVALIEMLQPRLAAQFETQRNAIAPSPSGFRRAVAPVYLRRNTKEVLKELPEKIEVKEWVDLSPKDRSAYVDSLSRSHMMTVRQVVTLGDGSSRSAKMARLLELIGQHADEGRKVLVFSFFKKVLQQVAEACDVVGVIQGSVSMGKREQMIREFQSTEGHAVLAAQILAGGVGLNLQAASVVVIMEPQWKPATESQAIARAHRMGQVRSVLVHRLLARDSVDARMTEILEGKAGVFNRYAQESYLKRASADAMNPGLLHASEQSLSELILETERNRLGIAPAQGA